MKPITFFLFAILVSLQVTLAQVQGVAINTDNSQASPSAMLDVKSTNRGVLLPRMTQAQRNAIVTPATGLLIYQTDEKSGFYFFDGTVWTLLATQNSSAPVGTVQAFGGTLDKVPAGWLPCDGSEVSRTLHADLFAVLGTAWGTGNGTTTFNVPNFQGRFLRGVDGGSGIDPNAATRTAFNGGNTGNQVGSYQLDGISSHLHAVNINVTTSTNGAHQHDYLKGKDNGFGDDSNDRQQYEATENTATSSAGDHNHTFTVTGNTNNTGGSETRPKNAYVYYIIKR